MKPKLVLCGSALNKAKNYVVNLGNITSGGGQAQMIDREENVCPIVSVDPTHNQTTDGVGGIGGPVNFSKEKAFTAPQGGRGHRSMNSQSLSPGGRGRSPKNR